MTYRPKLTLGEDWAGVTYHTAQYQSGKFGAYYQIFVEHEGENKYINATEQQYRDTIQNKNYKYGDELSFRKTGGNYPELHCKPSSETVRRIALSNLDHDNSAND